MRRFDTLQMELSGKILIFNLNHLDQKNRNIRFALSTDGMNPFGENRTVHSTWPVILVMYNLFDMVVSQKKVPYIIYSYPMSKASWHQY
jgi:hypothetical protein